MSEPAMKAEPQAPQQHTTITTTTASSASNPLDLLSCAASTRQPLPIAPRKRPFDQAELMQLVEKMEDDEEEEEHRRSASHSPVCYSGDSSGDESSSSWHNISIGAYSRGLKRLVDEKFGPSITTSTTTNRWAPYCGTNNTLDLISWSRAAATRGNGGDNQPLASNYNTK